MKRSKKTKVIEPQTFPDEIWKLIFSYTPNEDQSWMNVFRTSKSFYKLSRDIFLDAYSKSSFDMEATDKEVERLQRLFQGTRRIPQ